MKNFYRRQYQSRPLNAEAFEKFFSLVKVPEAHPETLRGFVAGVACQPGDEPSGFPGARECPETRLWREGYREGSKFRAHMLGASRDPKVGRLHQKMFLAVLGEAQRVGKAALA